MISFVAIVGIVVGLAHGWLYSFAALYPGLKPTSFLLVGAGLATFLLIGIQVGVGPLVNMNGHGANFDALLEFSCLWLAWLLLLWWCALCLLSRRRT
jgi:hypothetical protein